MDVVSSLPQVAGGVVYLTRTAEKPYTYTYDPPAGAAKTNIVGEPHTVPVFDMRPIADGLSLDVQGFVLAPAPTTVTDFYDEAQLRGTPSIRRPKTWWSGRPAPAASWCSITRCAGASRGLRTAHLVIRASR